MVRKGRREEQLRSALIGHQMHLKESFSILPSPFFLDHRICPLIRKTRLVSRAPCPVPPLRRGPAYLRLVMLREKSRGVESHQHPLSLLGPREGQSVPPRT